MNAVPTESGSCTTLLAAVISAILCSRLLFAASIDDAERSSPANNPLVSIGCVFAH